MACCSPCLPFRGLVRSSSGSWVADARVGTAPEDALACPSILARVASRTPLVAPCAGVVEWQRPEPDVDHDRGRKTRWLCGRRRPCSTRPRTTSRRCARRSSRPSPPPWRPSRTSSRTPRAPPSPTPGTRPARRSPTREGRPYVAKAARHRGSPTPGQGGPAGRRRRREGQRGRRPGQGGRRRPGRQAARRGAEKKKGGKLKKLALFAAVAGAVGFVAKKLQGGRQSDNWQSSYVPTPAPAPAPAPRSTTPAAPPPTRRSPTRPTSRSR